VQLLVRYGAVLNVAGADLRRRVADTADRHEQRTGEPDEALRIRRESLLTDKKIKPLSVITGKLNNQAVVSNKLADQAVTTDKVADNAVGSSKIADLAVTTGKLGVDSVTAPKLAGTTDGIATRSVPANSTLNVTATCPAGGQAISAGYFTPTSGAVQVTRMRRDSDNSWAFTFKNTAATAQGVDARVTCLVG
jgi:hypothetical protein